MKVLFIGDIVGSPGRDAIRGLLPKIVKREEIDFAVSNAENVAGGSGITPKTADELFALGLDVITSGDHIWRRKEVEDIVNYPNLLRPANLAKDAPGKGVCVYKKSDLSLGVINLQGRVFMNPIECPFVAVREILPELKKNTDCILVDMHAEATSEKRAMGWFLDGLVSACVGTHTHIQTADEEILPEGSAYITDVGMTGPCDSVIGRKKEKIIQAFVTGMPARFELASADIQLQGVVIDIDTKTGKANSIKRIKEKLS